MNWFSYSIVTIFAFALGVIFLTVGLKKGMTIPSAMLILSLVGIIVFGSLIFKTGTGELTKKTVFFVSLAGLFVALGSWTQYGAIVESPSAGLVIAIASCQAGLIAFLSWLFLGEGLNLFQILGIIVCVLGVVIIGLASR